MKDWKILLVLPVVFVIGVSNMGPSESRVHTLVQYLTVLCIVSATGYGWVKAAKTNMFRHKQLLLLLILLGHLLPWGTTDVYKEHLVTGFAFLANAIYSGGPFGHGGPFFFLLCGQAILAPLYSGVVSDSRLQVCFGGLVNSLLLAWILSGDDLHHIWRVL